VSDEEKQAVGETDSAYVLVTFDRCDHIEGPFCHRNPRCGSQVRRPDIGGCRAVLTRLGRPRASREFAGSPEVMAH
jgi:hypothetical protein